SRRFGGVRSGPVCGNGSPANPRHRRQISRQQRSRKADWPFADRSGRLARYAEVEILMPAQNLLAKTLGLPMALPLTMALAMTLTAPAYAQEAPATSGTPMTAEEFDSYATGKTLTYSQYGQIFGTEEYLPNRRVRWQVTGDLCQYGH